MTPQQKIKFLILENYYSYGNLGCTDYEEGAIEAAYEALRAEGLLDDSIEEVRCSGVKTNISSRKYNRCYETNSVAAELPDGSWVGWTYWYGGGKYGQPSGMPWIEDAYEVSCVEELVTTVKRTFKKV